MAFVFYANKKRLLYIFTIALIGIIEICLIFSCVQNASLAYAEVDESLIPVINELIQKRNRALLSNNIALLETMYNKKIRNSLWAYSHEAKKAKYLQEWAYKQSVTFLDINSHVVVRSTKKAGANSYNVNLLVSTEYKYAYDNDSSVTNTFRIGTHHSLNIKQEGDAWLIMREWYTDPFADSLAMDGPKSEEIRLIIANGKPRDLSNLNPRRVKAVEYADKYVGAANTPENGFSYNPKYKNFNPEGGDCANFASQILFEGGGFRKNRTWNYEKGAGTRAWLNASGFNSYMRSSGRASLIAYGSYSKVLKLSYNLLPGDYIAYEKKGDVKHISVVTGLDSKGYPLVNCHNTDRYRVPWDLGWSDSNIRFYLVRVHY